MLIHADVDLLCGFEVTQQTNYCDGVNEIHCTSCFLHLIQLNNSEPAFAKVALLRCWAGDGRRHRAELESLLKQLNVTLDQRERRERKDQTPKVLLLHPDTGSVRGEMLDWCLCSMSNASFKGAFCSFYDTWEVTRLRRSSEANVCLTGFCPSSRLFSKLNVLSAPVQLSPRPPENEAIGFLSDVFRVVFFK